MSQKWNLQDIRPNEPTKERVGPPSQRRLQQDIAPVRKQQVRRELPQSTDSDLGEIDIVDGNKMKRKKVAISAIVVLSVVFIGYFVNILLGGAEITVYPRYKDVTIQQVFIAHREPQADQLGFELLSYDIDGERQVKASGKQTVKEQTQGEIFIYNTKSTSVQRLIKNTRFESPDGLIFRIKDSVDVPGATKSSTGELVPGVITAEVFADGPGEQYNIAPTRFTVPGLKGSDQFESVYGESTVSFSGGFEGERYVIDDNELNTAKQELHLELRNSLLAKLDEMRPAGFILYKDAVSISFESLPSVAHGEDMATIKEKAYVQVPIFKEDEFATYIAEGTIATYEHEPIQITDPYTLSFTYPSSTTTTSNIGNYTELEFMLKGSVQLVWLFDENELKKYLAGKPKTALQNVMSDTSTDRLPLDRAIPHIRPFWEGSFPENIEKIEIIKVIGADTSS